MFTLRYSYDNFGIEENNLLYRLIILYFMNIGINSKKIVSLDDTTHFLLYGKRTEKLLMLSTGMRTVNELLEAVTAIVKS